jgi:hypothetical protein
VQKSAHVPFIGFDTWVEQTKNRSRFGTTTLVKMALRSSIAQSFCLCGWLSGVLSFATPGFSAPGEIPAVARAKLEAKFAEVLAAAPALPRNVEVRPARAQTARLLARERLEGKWIAALVSEEGTIEARFATWKGLADFLEYHEALVEVWAYTVENPLDGNATGARRLTAIEVAQLKRAPLEQPTFVTASFREAEKVKKVRLEWGLRAAEQTAAAEAGYARHREIQLAMRKALGSRDERGRITPQVQWQALQAAIQDQAIPLREMPARPLGDSNLFLAVEYEMDQHGHGTNIARVYRESQIQRHIARQQEGGSLETLRLWGSRGVREASAFRVRPGTDSLDPAPSPVLGQEAVELRIKPVTLDPALSPADPRQWNLVEFGEPELLRQSALAHFSLINAHLERQRKALAVKKSNLDLIAEPIIAALNVGGGLAGAGFPYGEAARLAYNLITPKYIADVPTVKEMRELFALLAAKRRDPQLEKKLAHFLSSEDVRKLEENARELTDDEVDEFARNVSDSDLEAMVFLARMRRIDARVTNFLNILTSAAKVSGEAESGLMREIFNNSYVSLNGEWSIKNSLAAVLGEQLITSRNSVPLDDLVHGRGPAKAWLQYFDFTVDLRALVNTIGRMPRRGFAEKELYKPLPYALHMGDLAAYEIRVFGFPLFIFYKRGLIKADRKAFEEDYAYAVDGAKILEHFQTRDDMDREIRAGHMVPIGYVKVPDGKGGWKDTNLAVFAHRIPSGRHRGKMVLVIYGIKAYADHSQVIERELKRLRQFERALQEGGVIEQVVETNRLLAGNELEPRLHVGEEAVATQYARRLAHLLEDQRAQRRFEWGIAAEAAPPLNPEKLLSADRFYSSFLFRNADGDVVELTLIPSVETVERSAARAATAREVERARREGLSRNGVVLLNSVTQVDGRYEIGPLLTNGQGGVVGAGLRVDANQIEQVLAAVERLPAIERARFQDNNCAATLLDLELEGMPRPVFVTIEFPPTARTMRERTNALTGELERLLFEDGKLKNITTPRRFTEMIYDEAGPEIASRTYTTESRRVLIEESRTLRTWPSPPARSNAYAPRMLKLRVNYATGELKHETFGSFAQPVATVDDQFVTTNVFNTTGQLQSTRVFDNGQTEADFERPVAEKLLFPTRGRERFAIRATQLADGGAQLHASDLVKGLEKSLLLDRLGRKSGESWTERLAPGQQLATRVHIEYGDNFFHGLVPVSTRTVSAGQGPVISQSATLDYDPYSRRLRAAVTDYTGRTTTNLWDFRWEAPIQVETAPRITTSSYDRAETTVRGKTVTRTTGEDIARFEGTFAGGLWQIHRTNLYQPEIPNGVETLLFNGFGRAVGFQTRAVASAYFYGAGGILTNIVHVAQSLASGVTNRSFLRSEGEFRWTNGFRHALVRDAARGEYRTISDPEGRVLVDDIREVAGITLLTTNAYDGESGRVLRSEQVQNGQRRNVRIPHKPLVSTDGTWRLPVAVTPAWGLSSTQIFVLGDPFGKPVAITFEDGGSVRLSDRRPGGPEWETRGPDGRAIYRTIPTEIRSSVYGVPYQIFIREKISPWGTRAVAEEQAFWPGTDILVFSQSATERTYYDLTKPYASALFAADPFGRNGVMATIGGTARSNVLRTIKQSISNDMVVTESRDVTGLFSQGRHRRVADRGGNVIAEHVARTEGAYNREIPSPQSPQDPELSPPAIIDYYYDPGWLQGTPQDQALIFVTNGTGMRVNDGGRHDFVTRLDVRDGTRVLRRTHSPRLLATNIYMPDRPQVWTAWTADELGPAGEELFQSELIYDASGRLVISKTIKRAAGGPAVKITYDIGPAAQGELGQRMSTNGNVVLPPVTAHGARDIEFVYWYAFTSNRTGLSWSIRDTSGTTIHLTNGEPDFRRGTVAFWPVGSGHTLWLPDPVKPEHASVVRAPVPLAESNAIFVVSAHDLQRAGLRVAELQNVQARAGGNSVFTLLASPIYQLRRGADALALRDRRIFTHQTIHHSSGLTTYIAAEKDRTLGEVNAGQRMASVTTYNDLPVLAAYSVRGKTHVYVVDYSPDSPRPLYAIWPREGRFLEYYKLARRSGSEVYAIVQSFELPRVEIFDPRALADEVFPSTIAYGRNYEVSYHPARGRGWLGESLAALESRVVANTFGFGGQKVFDHLGWTNLGRTFSPAFPYRVLQRADNQARDIGRLPMLAEALLAGRQVPWSAADSPPLRITNDWNAVGFALGRQHLNPEYPTGLIPTAPGTAVERFVDTDKEADLIILAIKVGELVLARELLDFYWQKSQGGQAPLHASYDARAGTAMTADLSYARPVHAPRTAAAQIAIADAAFTLGWETGESQWITFGRNLVELVLERFRASASGGAPRGIVEQEYLPVRRAYGFTLWPNAELYSLRSNARLAILLKRLAQISDRFSDRTWRFAVREALREQEAWLRTTVMAELERAGVPPKGWFKIQDIAGETTAIAPERWTSAEDWLAVIEAAHELGLPADQSRRWLENLARVHGVQTEGIWGLDWSVATLRPDVISADLTADFSRVAERIGHTSASTFALSQIARLKREGSFSAVATSILAQRPIQTGQGPALHPRADSMAWPATFAPYKELRLLGAPAWNLSNVTAQIATIPVSEAWPRQQTDMTVFVLITASVYLAILGSAIFWWTFRVLRRREPARAFPDQLVPDPVMQLAEERWARRVLGVHTPSNAERSRFSNAPVEANFLMQLRAVYKLIVEWRRQENGWSEDDRRIVDAENDEWLNGLDEYACVLGLYMRWVIKAGAKDGFDKENVLEESEDSNHIWSRLVMFCSEYYWGVLTLLKNYNNLVLQDDKTNLYAQMAQLLSSFGVRQRSEPFDARTLFNYPEDRSAMDLLVLQQPGRTLDQVLIDASKRLRVPYLHLVRIVERYKEFKRRENPVPIHPYTIELAKILPHFLLMGLGALVWYNQRLGDSPIVPYVWSVVVQLALSPLSLIWAVPLLASMLLAVTTHFVRIYRFDAPMLAREKTELFLDATLTSLFVKRHSVMPKSKQGHRWNPDMYERTGWVLRTIGWLGLGITLLSLDTPSFATFLVVKGILAMLVLAEVAAMAFPLAATAFSKFLQDWVKSRPACGRFVRFTNKLNITATRPASPLWLSFKYHTQPSVLTGDFSSMTQAILFYFVLGAVFFFAGGYLCQQILSLWFMDTYLAGSNWKLFFGGLLFWNTMYLLRYGLFLFFTGIASAFVTFPIKTIFALLATVYLVLILFGGSLDVDLTAYPALAYSLMFLALLLMAFESGLVKRLRRSDAVRRQEQTRQSKTQAALKEIKASRSATLGVVYMSGDDLSHQKLTTGLLMERWTILRDRLGSNVIQMLLGALTPPADATLRQWLDTLYGAEKRSDVTLWHPIQLAVAGERPALAPELGLTVHAQDAAQRAQLLAAWHVRRWLVSMMSTAGHSQDTAINLVDVALRLSAEGLAANTVFYLVQNKYDNSDGNRPSQSVYDQGELGHRNKLARLLMELAPGVRAYSVQNWTPFGFKAGGLTGMDLVHEESLKLTTMLLLDRNATVHDLDALMADLTAALTDPDVVIVIPGRGTTNTLTSVGQGSQMVEEGHRSFLKGLMGLLGGRASEAVGTGWGNLLAVYYGRVQRALVDAHSPKMPLTSRMRRGSSFAVRAEGLIGFGPHAVGISEDTWAVSQTAHNAMALGHRVKFLVSRAIWHKIRETWSHSEWLASFPRWSGGYLQMMHDPIMQRVNDFGASSVFAKEVRAHSGRNFLSAPFALFNILFMPLAIMLDITPFIQILVVLWNFGFVMNQILTVHGLNTYLESSGFYRVPAFIGAGLAGAWCWFSPAVQPFAPGLIVAGFLVGGFFVGLSRWLYTRMRDMLLFGPQLVLHALGQVVRQTLEFTVSGASPQDARGVNMAFRTWAGPREDRPWEGYLQFINLKTVIWGVGLLSVVLNLFALANLDMLNVLLLLPSLLFSASALLGPFLLRPRLGTPLGKRSFLPRILGWIGAFVFYVVVSMLIARGAWLKGVGILVFFAVFALVLRHGLRFLGYRRKWRKLREQLCALLKPLLPDASSPRAVAEMLMQHADKPEQLAATLDRARISGDHHSPVLHLLEHDVGPMLRHPVTDRRVRWMSDRFASDFSRSFALGLLILIWFFVVPVPGVLVFTAGSYRLSMDLASVVQIVGWAVAVVVLSAWLGRIIQWLDRSGPGKNLTTQFARAWGTLREAFSTPGQLPPASLAQACALLTDVQTYLDQRSFSYARHSLMKVESILAGAKVDPP